MPGPRLHLRPLRADDDAALDSWFAALSEHSRTLRFFSPTPRLTATTRALLLAGDGPHRLGVVAEVGHLVGREVVGIAHLAGVGSEVGPETAEVALAVTDAWQGRGIGRRLLTALAAAARSAGYQQLLAYALESWRIQGHHPYEELAA